MTVYRRNVTWKPIEPSPAARSKIKINVSFLYMCIVNWVQLRLALGYLCIHAILAVFNVREKNQEGLVDLVM